MRTLALPLLALFDPFGAVPRAVEGRRWVLPLLLLCALSAGAGAAVGARLDTARLVIPRMEQSGELAKASEREIADAVQQAQRVGIVGGVAKGVFLMPLALLALAVGLKLVAWLFGKKVSFLSLWTVAAVAMLPIALADLATIFAALAQDSIAPKLAAQLLPSSLAALGLGGPPRLAGLWRAFDFFNLWAVLILGVGFASATRWSAWRGVLLGAVLYVLFAAVAYVGLPGLMAGAAGGLGGP